MNWEAYPCRLVPPVILTGETNLVDILRSIPPLPTNNFHYQAPTVNYHDLTPINPRAVETYTNTLGYNAANEILTRVRNQIHRERNLRYPETTPIDLTSTEIRAIGQFGYQQATSDITSIFGRPIRNMDWVDPFPLNPYLGVTSASPTRDYRNRNFSPENMRHVRSNRNRRNLFLERWRNIQEYRGETFSWYSLSLNYRVALVNNCPIYQGSGPDSQISLPLNPNHRLLNLARLFWRNIGIPAIRYKDKTKISWNNQVILLSPNEGLQLRRGHEPTRIPSFSSENRSSHELYFRTLGPRPGDRGWRDS